MVKKRRSLLLGTLFFFAVAATPAPAGEEPSALWVTEAWIRAVPPVSQVTAGYMVVANHDGWDKTLVEVRSPWFKRVMLHRSLVKDGMATMEHQDRLTIPARGRVELKPGGYHLMLFEPRHSLNLGEKVPLVLVLEDGSEVEVSAPVRQGDAEDHGHHHH